MLPTPYDRTRESLGTTGCYDSILGWVRGQEGRGVSTRWAKEEVLHFVQDDGWWDWVMSKCITCWARRNVGGRAGLRARDGVR